jgi:hypothetical protein
MKIGQFGKSNIEFLNLISTDATRIENGINFLQTFFVVPLKIMCTTIILVHEVDNQILFGLVLFPFLIPLKSVLGRLLTKYK